MRQCVLGPIYNYLDFADYDFKTENFLENSCCAIQMVTRKQK